MSPPMAVDPEIREALEAGTLVLCVGPGPSLAAGLPGPADFARLLLDRARELHGSPELDGLERWIEQGRIAEVLEQLERRLGADFQREVERTLSDQGLPLPPIVRSIAQLRTKLRAIYTVRLDRLIERALEGRWPSFSAARPDLSQRRSMVFKLRGTLEFPQTWVLTREQEQREFGPEGARRAIVEASFRAHQLLLIGFALGGAELSTLLDMLPASVDGHGPRHHIVLPACDRLERTQLESRGLRVIIGDAQALLDELAGHEAEQLGAAPSASQNPYPGLEAFTEQQAGVFFGRHAEISQAAALLGGVGGIDNHWLAIEGPSGVGKSSFARAGVLPALRRGFAEGTPGRWQVAKLRPGMAPLTQLARAVAAALELPAPSDPEQLRSNPRWLIEQAQRLGPGQGLLLLVDQLEEIATISPTTERAPFGELLTRALDAKAIYLITTTRSDLVPALQRELPSLASLLNGVAQRYALPPISRVGLREAICEPAARHGVSIEQALVEQILLDAERGQSRASEDHTRTADATLPLVAHILRGLWTEQNIADRVITLDEYTALGGLTGALSRSADELIEALGDRPQIRELFLRLIRLQPDGTATRRVMSLEEARALSDDRTLGVLSGAQAPREGAKTARLLLVREADGTQEVEIVHEALIRDWSRLSEWIEQGKAQLELDEELARRAARWKAQGGRREDLPRGGDMQSLLQARVNGSAEERKLQAEFQAAMQRVRTRRRMLLTGGLAAGLALAVAIPMMFNIDPNTCSINIDKGPKISHAAVLSAGDVKLATVVPQTTIIYACDRSDAKHGRVERSSASTRVAMIEFPRWLARAPLAIIVPKADEPITLIVEDDEGEIFHFADVRADATLDYETQKTAGLPSNMDETALAKLGELEGFADSPIVQAELRETEAEPDEVPEIKADLAPAPMPETPPTEPEAPASVLTINLQPVADDHGFDFNATPSPEDEAINLRSWDCTQTLSVPPPCGWAALCADLGARWARQIGADDVADTLAGADYQQDCGDGGDVPYESSSGDFVDHAAVIQHRTDALADDGVAGLLVQRLSGWQELARVREVAIEGMSVRNIHEPRAAWQLELDEHPGKELVMLITGSQSGPDVPEPFARLLVCRVSPEPTCRRLELSQAKTVELRGDGTFAVDGAILRFEQLDRADTKLTR